MKKNDIRALGVSAEVAKLFDAYTNAIQGDGEGDFLSLLAQFVQAARREDFAVDSAHIDIALPIEVWGLDVSAQNGDFVDAMTAMLDLIENEQRA